jgi:hypothetical protein
MYKLMVISLFATLSIAASAESMSTRPDPIQLASAAGAVMIGSSFWAYGGLPAVAISATALGTVAKAKSASEKKLIAFQIKSDIQAYNFDGAMSPSLENFINEYRNNNIDSSNEDAISALEIEVNEQFN